MAEIEAKKLFTEFPPVTTEQWEAEIQKDLKGADYEKKLVWNTLEGFKVRPYYRAEDLKSIKHLGTKPGEFPYVRGTKESNDWLVRQQIMVSCPKAANAEALDILMKGVNSLDFVIDNKEFSAADLDTLLNQIVIKSVELNFSGCGAKHIAPLFIAKVKKAGLVSEDVVASFNIDPIIKKLTLKGKDTVCSCGENLFDTITGLIKGAAEYRRVRFVTVNGTAFNNAGANLLEELSFSLAAGHDYIVELMNRGLSIDEAARNIKFNLSVGPLYFMEMAKFRAARMLWANIVKQYNPQNDCSMKMRVNVITSLWNMTVYDPYVNMLRATTESMSAAIANVNSIEVRPFDSAYETPTDFANRIARNVQHLLREETHFNHVADAAGGSYYIETLTQTLADGAWDLFKEVETKGGYMAAFKAGFINERINATAAKRNKNIETRRDILLGTNQYPNFTEKIKGLSLDKKCNCKCSEKAQYTPLTQYRGGEAFETLRLKTDAAAKTPKAFMLTVGSVSFARARSQFACNFFGCAGIETVDNIMFSTIEEGLKAACAAKAEIVVLCSSDEEYATLAPEAFEALGNKAIFVVAGAPACQAELEAKGIKNFISVRSNVLETLKGYQQQLGI